MTLLFIFTLVLVVYISYMITDLKNKINTHYKFYMNLIKEKNGEFISFKKSIVKSGLPLIKLTVGGERYGFLLDSGANVNWLDKDCLGNIPKSAYELTSCEGIESYGASGSIEVEDKVCDLNFSYGNTKFKESFKVASLAQGFKVIEEETGYKLCGILGNEFFQEYRWKLDFDRMVVWIK